MPGFQAATARPERASRRRGFPSHRIGIGIGVVLGIVTSAIRLLGIAGGQTMTVEGQALHGMQSPAAGAVERVEHGFDPLADAAGSRSAAGEARVGTSCRRQTRGEETLKNARVEGAAQSTTSTARGDPMTSSRGSDHATNTSSTV